MKNLLKFLCLISLIYCIYFPFSYFGKDSDKKEIKLNHILFDTEEDARQVLQEIREGKTFETTVKEYEKNNNILPVNEGYYGRNGNLIPAFEEAAFKLKPHLVSNPVKTEYGWHIIKVYDIKYYSDAENFQKLKPSKFNNLYIKLN